MVQVQPLARELSHAMGATKNIHIFLKTDVQRTSRKYFTKILIVLRGDGNSIFTN